MRLRGRVGTRVALALAGVLALHAAAGLGLSAALEGGWAAPHAAAVPLSVRILSMAAAPALPGDAEAVLAVTPPAPWSASASASASASESARAPDATARQADSTMATVAGTGPATLFLDSHAVDTPAQPLGSWTLDADALAALGITRVLFDGWVDAQAQLVAVRVVALEPAALQPLAPLLEARLLATPMQAARKDGSAVAHRQRIELRWEHGAAPG